MKNPLPGGSARSFPIVGIGASAGGFEAVFQFLDHLSPDTGMAFVIIQHLDPLHASALSELFSRNTRMPVAKKIYESWPNWRQAGRP